VQKQQERVDPEAQEAAFAPEYCTKRTSLCNKIRFYNLMMASSNTQNTPFKVVFSLFHIKIMTKSSSMVLTSLYNN